MVFIRDGGCRHNRHPEEHCGLGVLLCPLHLAVYIGRNLPHFFFTLVAAEDKALAKDFYLYELLLYHYSILDSVYLVVAHCGLWFNSPRPRAGGWFDTVGAGSDKLSADCWLSAPST